MRFPRAGRLLVGPVFLALTALAACNGGSSSAPAFPTGTAAPTAPAAVPTLAPASAASSVPLAAGAATAQPVTIPPADGLSGAFTLPAATIPAGETLNVTTTTTIPTGVPALSEGRRVLATSTGLQVLYYQGVQFTQTVTFPAFPAFTIALPSGYNTALGVFNLAFYDGNGWSFPLGAAGTPNGQSLSFASAPGPVTYQANQRYYFALYYAPSPPAPTPTPTASPTASPTVAPTATPSPSPTAVPSSSPTAVPTATPTPTATPSPTPTPTPTPTPSPTPTPGPLTATPSVLSFLGIGANLAQTVTVSSSFYTGGFTTTACTNAAATTVATVSAVGSNGTFTVTPVAVGACAITVSDAANRQTQVSVTVATSSITVKSRKH